MRKEVCSRQGRCETLSTTEWFSGFPRHFYPTITCKKVGYHGHVLVNCNVVDKGHFGFLQQIPFFGYYENFKYPKSSMWTAVGSFYVNWRRTCHLGPFEQQPSPEIFYFWLSVWTFCSSNATVPSDCCQHSSSGLNSLDSFLFVVRRARNNVKRTFVKTPEDDGFGQKQFQAPTPMNYWTHPASQPAFRFPPKHLSHLWLDPCCLDTVHAVVIGPYPNQ